VDPWLAAWLPQNRRSETGTPRCINLGRRADPAAPQIDAAEFKRDYDELAEKPDPARAEFLGRREQSEVG